MKSIKRESKFILLLSSFVFCLIILVLVEFGIRALNPEIISPNMETFRNQFDTELGWVTLANSEKHNTDAFGLRINPALEDKHLDTGLPAILFLGDSVTWGYCTNASGTFISTLDNQIKDWRLLNAAVPGYNTIQEHLLYQRIGSQLPHQLVILAVSGNDFASNTFQEYPKYPAPYALMNNGDMEIVRIPTSVTRRHTIALKLKQSALFRLISIKTPGRRFSEDKIAPLDNQEEIMRELILRIQQEADSHDARLLVVLLPTEKLLTTDSPLRTRGWVYWAVLQEKGLLPEELEDFEMATSTKQEELGLAIEQLESPTIDPRFRRLVEFGRDENINIVDLTEPIYDIYSTLPQDTRDNFYCEWIHFNSTGHQSIANILEGIIIASLKAE